MSISMYDISIASYLQIIRSVSDVLEKGKTHFLAQGEDLNKVMEYRLCDDMQPFRFQLISVMHHSLGSIRGIQAGAFSPPPAMPELDYQRAQELLNGAFDELSALSHHEVNGLLGKNMIFKIGDKEIPFTAENFVMSFSLPNLNFHATTAYDMLRMKGVPIGKRDYLGKMRIG